MKLLQAILPVAVGLWVFSVGGCGNSDENIYAHLQHEDPSVRIEAIHRAGQVRNTGAVPFLVDRLTDSQVDVRFFTIIALEKITGKTMGYRYYDPPGKRIEAVQRWRELLDLQDEGISAGGGQEEREVK